MKSYEKHLVAAEHASMTVEAFLKKVLKISGRAIQRLTRQKGVLLNGKAVYLKRELKAGDVVQILAEKDYDLGVTPERGYIDSLYEDQDVIVLNKPPRQLVHPAGQTTQGTLSNYLAYELMIRGDVKTIRPVNRLDRDTSGCIVFSKSAKVQALLETQIKNRTLNRIYLALVDGVLPQETGTVDAPIALHPSKPNQRTVSAKGETAITHYRVIAQSNEASLLELKLETGRTHQIRVHMSYIGHPIIGDAMYGKRSPSIERQALHAVSVSFQRLTDNSEVLVKAPVPEDFSRAIESSLGKISFE